MLYTSPQTMSIHFVTHRYKKLSIFDQALADRFKSTYNLLHFILLLILFIFLFVKTHNVVYPAIIDGGANKTSQEGARDESSRTDNKRRYASNKHP